MIDGNQFFWNRKDLPVRANVKVNHPNPNLLRLVLIVRIYTNFQTMICRISEKQKVWTSNTTKAKLKFFNDYTKYISYKWILYQWARRLIIELSYASLHLIATSILIYKIEGFKASVKECLGDKNSGLEKGSKAFEKYYTCQVYSCWDSDSSVIN